MPQKGYANITVKASTYYKFLTEAEHARYTNPAIDNSSFLEILLDGKLHRPDDGSTGLKSALTNPEDIADLASALGVADLLPAVLSIYRQTSSGAKMQDRKYMACAALYIACKQSSTPRTLQEIADAANLDTDRLFSHVTSIVTGLGLNISSTDPAAFVPRIAYCINARKFKYSVSEKSVSDAVALLEKIKDVPVVRQRSPLTIAAWALYRSCKQNRDNISQKSIASCANIVDTTLRNMEQLVKKRGQNTV